MNDSRGAWCSAKSAGAGPGGRGAILDFLHRRLRVRRGDRPSHLPDQPEASGETVVLPRLSSQWHSVLGLGNHGTSLSADMRARVWGTALPVSDSPRRLAWIEASGCFLDSSVAV